MKTRTSGKSIASMICGIVSLFTFFIPVFGFMLSWIAIGLATSGMKETDEPNVMGKGMAIAGLVMGILTVVPSSILFLVVCIAIL